MAKVAKEEGVVFGGEVLEPHYGVGFYRQRSPFWFGKQAVGRRHDARDLAQSCLQRTERRALTSRKEFREFRPFIMTVAHVWCATARSGPLVPHTAITPT